MEKGLKGLFNRLNNIEIKFDYGGKSPLSGKKLYIFAFFIPVIILLVSYMIAGMYPAGDNSILIYDLKDQYFNYYNYFWDAFHGSRSLLNSWSRSLNGETIGMFAYYIASPFNIIVFLLPKSMIMESLLIVQLLKAGAASAAFSFYLRRSKRVYDSTALIFSILYSSTAYMVIHLINIMWLDGLILLPLICFGIEKLVDESRCLPFVIPLVVMFTSNFYIGYMLAIFSCIYFLAYYFFISETCRELRIYNVLIKGIRFAVSGILSALCSAWLLIPLYFSLVLGKFDITATNTNTDITTFNFLSLFVNFLPNTFDTLMEGGSPLVYCGILTLILIPIYFFNSSIDLRKRIGYGVLAASIIISMYVYGLDLIWHGSKQPVGSPNRYSFILCFLLLVMAAQSFDRLDKTSYKSIGCVFFLILGYIVYIDSQNIVLDILGRKYEKANLVETIWFSVIMIVIYSILIYFHKKYYRIKPIPLIMTFFIGAEAIFTSADTLNRLDNIFTYAPYEIYKENFSVLQDIANTINDMDNSVYRMERKSNYLTSQNEAMSFGRFGVSHTSSVPNAAVDQFLRRIGFFYDGMYITKYKGATYVTDAILGIKYIMDQDFIEDPETEKNKSSYEKYFEKISNIMNGYYYEREEAQHYDTVLTREFNLKDEKYNMNVYENPYALPIGFMADNSIADLKLTSWENPYENQNLLLSSLLSDEKQDFFVRIDIDDILMKNAERTIYDGHDRYSSLTEGTGGIVLFKLTAPSNEMIYMFLPSDYEKTSQISINYELMCRYFMNDYMVSLPIGRFESGEEFTVTVTFSDVYGEVMFKDKLFYYLDEEKFSEAIDKLKQHPLEIESFREDHIKGTVTSEKDGILFTSISYEPGWSIYVDGEKTEPVKLADALIGIPMSEGTHTVEMKFFPKGMAPGIVISVISIAAVVLIGLYEHKKYFVKK